MADKLKNMPAEKLIDFLQYTISDKCNKYEKLLLPSNFWIFSKHKSEDACKWIVDNLKLDEKDDLIYLFIDNNFCQEKWKIELANKWLAK